MIFIIFFGAIIFLILESFSASLAWRIEYAWFSSERKKIKSTNEKLQFVFKGRSFCEVCGNTIGVKGLIPILGFFISHGKCKHCKSDIPVKYPIMETMAFLYGAGLAALRPEPTVFLITALTYPLLRVILHIDNRYMIIPSEMLFGVLLISFLESSVIRYGFNFSSSMAVDFFIAFSCFFLMHLLRILSKEGLGIADIRITLALALSLGFPTSIFFPTVAAILGIAAYFIFRGSDKINQKSMTIKVINSPRTKIAFGGFLVLAYWLLRLWPTY